MQAMQYTIALPSDYDMSIVRERVATRGHLLDQLPGLGLKAYLIRERSAECPVNQYAPLYLWTQAAAMGAFLWGGGGFQGIVADFGRPAVDHWAGAAFAFGAAKDAPVRAATIVREYLPADVDPRDRLVAARQWLKHRAGLEGVHSVAVAVAPACWEIMQCTLWAEGASPEPEGRGYQVLHLSAPHIHDLLPIP
jgi:Domain of unknown function (DUF4865)